MKQPVLLRVYFNGKLEGVRQFTESQIVIGRNADVQLDLQEEGVSPLHAVIEERDGAYYISDLGSQSGTLKNGDKVLDDRIESGDEIRVGPYRIEFFVGVPKPTAPPKLTEQKEEPKPSSGSAKPEPLKTAVEKDVKPAAAAKPQSITSKIPQKAPAKVKPVGVAAEFTQAPAAIPEGPSRIPPVISSSKRTFAPESEIKDLNRILKPGKGTVVEVVVAWKERIISTHHFNEKQVVTIGADEKSDIVVPVAPGLGSYPLVHIGAIVSVNIAPNTPGDLVTQQGSTSFAELSKQNRFRSVGNGHQLDLAQGEMVRVGFQGNLINVYIRYVPEAPKPLVAPLLDLTASEVTGVILATVVAAIFGLYMLIYAPTSLDDENKLEEPIRKATVTFRPPRRKEVVQMKEQEEKPKEVVKVVEKQRQSSTPQKTRAGDPGKAGEVKPKDTKSKKKTVTSARSGGAIKTGAKKGANMKSKKPDPSKVGLLSVFGSKGAQSKLDKAFSGSGELQGIADQATGSAGDSENRVGDNLGTKIKDTGAGGRGEQTVGISGVGTKGRGTGGYGLGTGGIGKKGSVDINIAGQDAQFDGSMDREAIRRVILANKRAIRSCYERELQRHPDMYGKLVLQWNIEEKGRVTGAQVKSNTLGSSEVATCIISRLRTWRFPEPPPGVVGQVVYPFVFTSQ